MTIKYVNSAFVKRKYSLSEIQFKDLLDYGLLRGHQAGRTLLFRKDLLPPTVQELLYVTNIVATSTANIG